MPSAAVFATVLLRRHAGEPIGGVPLPVAALAATTFVVHLGVAAWGPYELHRDALLYLAMGQHFQLLRMDFPPFIAILARTERLLGDSLVAIRLGPALAHTTLIVLAAAIARRVGGGAVAALLAALVVATAPVFLRAGSLFQPVVFDQLWWTLALYVVLRIGQDFAASRRRRPVPIAGDDSLAHPVARSERRLWLLLGAVFGLGLLTKFTILVLGAALLVGLIASPLGSRLATPWPWAAAGMALLIGSPSIIGQVRLGWPFLTQFQDLQTVQLSRVSPVSFTLEQLLIVGPIVLVAAAAAVRAAVRSRDPGVRTVGWTTIAAYGLMVIARGKPYYIAPIWPALLGIGLARAELLTRSLRMRQPLAAAGSWTLIGVAVIGFGVVALPMGLPFLPPDPMARYAVRLGVTRAVTTNTGERLELPQDYADMIGWKELADSVTAVWDGLPPEDRERGVILATNYGRAGAIDFYGPDRLPPVIAPVGSYWFWGPGNRPGDVTIVVGDEPAALEGRYFRTAMLARRVLKPWGVPEERDVPISIAREPVRTLQEVWPEFRGMN